MVNDILESLSPDKYIELSGILERQLPRSICAVYLLKNLIEWRKIKHNFNNFEWGQPEIGVDMKKIRVYVPKSGMQNGTFIIINELNKYNPYCINLFTLQDNCEELEKCLDSTLIDWTREPVFFGLHANHERILKPRIRSKNMRIVLECPAVYARIPKEQIRQDGILPTNYSFVNLSSDDAFAVNNWWPFKSEGSVNGVKLLLSLNGGFGIKNYEGKLVACATRNEVSAIAMLHVVEEERRKGLAQALIQKYCWNFVNEFNLDPTTIILTSNSQSRALFHKMGFEEIDEINIYCIKN